jgi:hypothetical protein
LQCGSPVHAIEFAAQAFTSSGKPIRSSSADDAVDLPRDVRDDEVLLPRDADVAADALGEVGDREHLVAGDEAEVHRHADRASPSASALDAEVVRRLPSTAAA